MGNPKNKQRMPKVFPGGRVRTTRMVCLLVMGILLLKPSSGEGQTLSIPGTGACEAVLKSVAAAYEQKHPLARVVIPPSVHSEGGIRQVLAGNAILARVSRPLKPEETGKKLVYRVFARDAVVFAVGAGVRTDGFTIRQIKDIFSGNVTMWEDLAAGKGPIRVLLREEGDACLKVLMARYPEIRAMRFTSGGKILYHDQEMVEMLQKYRNSIGFATMSSLGAASATITPIAIDGIAPTMENLSSATYPAMIEYALVYREGTLPPEARDFIDFLYSGTGRKLLADHGLSAPTR
jgi:phosphate transport system substrate-binding protein